MVVSAMQFWDRQGRVLRYKFHRFCFVQVDIYAVLDNDGIFS